MCIGIYIYVYKYKCVCLYVSMHGFIAQMLMLVISRNVCVVAVVIVDNESLCSVLFKSS